MSLSVDSSETFGKRIGILVISPNVKMFLPSVVWDEDPDFVSDIRTWTETTQLHESSRLCPRGWLPRLTVPFGHNPSFSIPCLYIEPQMKLEVAEDNQKDPIDECLVWHDK